MFGIGSACFWSCMNFLHHGVHGVQHTHHRHPGLLHAWHAHHIERHAVVAAACSLSRPALHCTAHGTHGHVPTNFLRATSQHDSSRCCLHLLGRLHLHSAGMILCRVCIEELGGQLVWRCWVVLEVKAILGQAFGLGLQQPLEQLLVGIAVHRPDIATCPGQTSCQDRSAGTLRGAAELQLDAPACQHIQLHVDVVAGFQSLYIFHRKIRLES